LPLGRLDSECDLKRVEEREPSRLYALIWSVLAGRTLPSQPQVVPCKRRGCCDVVAGHDDPWIMMSEYFDPLVGSSL
jgi:hypothetical protein